MRWLLVAVLAGCSQSATGMPDAATPVAGMTYVGQFVSGVLGGATITFGDSTRAPGDAVVFEIFDYDPSATATSYSLAAPGWTIASLGTSATSAVFAAIAPATSSGDFTLTSSSPAHNTYILADELGGVDPAGGSVTFDAYTSTTCPCSGTCATTLVTGHDGDAVWAALSPARLSAAGPGFTAGDILGAGPRTEYRITSDPAGTTETVSLTIDGLDGETCVLHVLAIKPR